MIDGSEQSSSAGERSTVIDPATANALAEVPDSTPDDVDRACRAAEHAFRGWRSTTPRERANALLEIANRIEARASEFCELESHNAGKPLKNVREDELPVGVDNLRFFAGAARCLQTPAAGEYLARHASSLRREPLGMVAQIAPWNYPLLMAIWKVGPALAAGNTVVLKPSELTPLTALLLAEVSAEVLPAGVLNVVCGSGSRIGESLVRHPSVAMVSLTGSVETGRRVMEMAAGAPKRVHLELGGKAPVIVFADSEIESAAESVAAAAFYNAGQDCTAATRVLAEKSVASDIGDALASAARRVQVGSPQDTATTMGPLISDAHRSDVMRQISERSNGARLACGGAVAEGPGFFLEPTVVVDVGQADALVQRELFGPVLTVQAFDAEDTAVTWANGTEYGLSASVWTNDLARANRVAHRIEAGIVWVNTHGVGFSEMPHGGRKASGWGSDMSVLAVEEYTAPKHVLTRID